MDRTPPSREQSSEVSLTAVKLGLMQALGRDKSLRIPAIFRRGSERQNIILLLNTAKQLAYALPDEKPQNIRFVTRDMEQNIFVNPAKIPKPPQKPSDKEPLPHGAVIDRALTEVAKSIAAFEQGRKEELRKPDIRKIEETYIGSLAALMHRYSSRFTVDDYSIIMKGVRFDMNAMSTLTKLLDELIDMDTGDYCDEVLGDATKYSLYDIRSGKDFLLKFAEKLNSQVALGGGARKDLDALLGRLSGSTTTFSSKFSFTLTHDRKAWTLYVGSQI